MKKELALLVLGITFLSSSFPTSILTQIISFEEAVELATYPGDLKWIDSSYRVVSQFQTAPVVTLDGLIVGYLEWHASNGSLYEVDSSTGEVLDEIEQPHSILGSTGHSDVEEYLVWRISWGGWNNLSR